MKQKTARVSIIILNWNGKHLLEQNLSSVLSQRYTSYEIIIVDNGSSDGSQKYIKELREKDNRIRFLETGKNFGYAEGNNKGIQFVLKEAKSKYIVILNNDVFVQKYWLRNLIRGFTINKVGVCTSKILLYYPYLPITLIPHEDCIIYSIKILDLNYHSLLFNDEIGRAHV
jgi:GT2 family glycosyltransferase